ncbi:MAG: HIT family hydrolase, partial [Pseudonocardia sp.]|nr:HIT family hydrolase [Pseudonocardia sp.]
MVGQDGAAVADGFRRLWTPHRLAYIKEAASSAEEGC